MRNKHLFFPDGGKKLKFGDFSGGAVKIPCPRAPAPLVTPLRLSQKAIQRRSQHDRQVKRKVFKLRRDTDDIPVASHSRVQEECHSRVQDPPQQRPNSGIEKYRTLV